MIRVIDIETTGTDPQRDDIIEIASADMVRGGGIRNAMDTLVRPAGPIPPGASAVHHLIDEGVRTAHLRWIIEKSELEEGIKRSARHWLTAATPPRDLQ